MVLEPRECLDVEPCGPDPGSIGSREWRLQQRMTTNRDWRLRRSFAVQPVAAALPGVPGKINDAPMRIDARPVAPHASSEQPSESGQHRGLLWLVPTHRGQRENIIAGIAPGLIDRWQQDGMRARFNKELVAFRNQRIECRMKQYWPPEIVD